MFSILTFNAALLDIRALNYSLHNPVPDVELRLLNITSSLQQLSADIVVLQEVFHRKHQILMARELGPEYPFISGLNTRPATPWSPQVRNTNCLHSVSITSLSMLHWPVKFSQRNPVLN